MADIFISYKREDKPKAAMLANTLTASGWTVWWDHDLLGGEDYDVIIERELASAKAVIVIWSALAVRSRNVKDEASKALQRNVLIPVSFDGTTPPIGFGMTHTLNFQTSNHISDEDYKKLLESIENKTHLPSRAAAASFPVKRKAKTPWFIAGAVILGLLIFIFTQNAKDRELSNENSKAAKKTEREPPDTGRSGTKTTDTNYPSNQLEKLAAPEVADYFQSHGRTLQETLPSDTILNYTIKEITQHSITLQVNYSYNTLHGNNVYLGAWFWKLTNAGGYEPVLLNSPAGTAEVTISLSELKSPITTEGLLIFLDEAYKGPFTCRVFSYQHEWNP